nr:HopJ type III effector protein [Thiofilum flexile]
MSIQALLEQLDQPAESLQFSQVIAVIDAHYAYTPQAFQNGALSSPAGTNEGSCKVFAFGLLQGLTQEQTLHCFAEHYRAVLAHPEGHNHANIRAFMLSGWEGIQFDTMPLVSLNTKS